MAADSWNKSVKASQRGLRPRDAAASVHNPAQEQVFRTGTTNILKNKQKRKARNSLLNLKKNGTFAAYVASLIAAEQTEKIVHFKRKRSELVVLVRVFFSVM